MILCLCIIVVITMCSQKPVMKYNVNIMSVLPELGHFSPFSLPKLKKCLTGLIGSFLDSRNTAVYHPNAEHSSAGLLWAQHANLNKTNKPLKARENPINSSIFQQNILLCGEGWNLKTNSTLFCFTAEPLWSSVCCFCFQRATSASQPTLGLTVVYLANFTSSPTAVCSWTAALWPDALCFIAASSCRALYKLLFATEESRVNKLLMLILAMQQ